jgi:hypothetical protein
MSSPIFPLSLRERAGVRVLPNLQSLSASNTLTLTLSLRERG